MNIFLWMILWSVCIGVIAFQKWYKSPEPRNKEIKVKIQELVLAPFFLTMIIVFEILKRVFKVK